MTREMNADDYSSQALAVLSNEDAVNLQRLEVFKDTAISIAGAAGHMAGSARVIAECVRDCVRIRCEMLVMMRNLDESWAHRRRRLQDDAGLMRRQIERMSDRVDRVLDQALSIDTAVATDKQLQDRAMLLEQVDRLSEMLSRVLAQYMSM